MFFFSHCLLNIQHSKLTFLSFITKQKFVEFGFYLGSRWNWEFVSKRGYFFP